MAMLQVYAKSIKTKYKSAVLSKSTFVAVLFGVFSIIGPFVFAYRSKGFWMKHDSFHEQPDIRFKGEYLLTATTNNPNKPISCSTYPYYQEYAYDFDKCSSIRVREIDENYDTIVDELTISLQIILPEKVSITSVNILVPLDYRLHKSCPLQMQSAILFQHYFNSPVSEISIYSDLAISQKSPLIFHRKLQNNFYNYSIITDETDTDSFKFERIIEEYVKRNLTTHLKNTYTNMLLGNTQMFQIKFDIRYPEHTFYYEPGFWQIMKYAWIQYYSIYIIVAWIIQHIKNYIFTNRLVLFYEECPIKKND